MNLAPIHVGAQGPWNTIWDHVAEVEQWVQENVLVQSVELPRLAENLEEHMTYLRGVNFLRRSNETKLTLTQRKLFATVINQAGGCTDTVADLLQYKPYRFDCEPHTTMAAASHSTHSSHST